MPNYYKTNAIYIRLQEEGLIPPYFFLAGNAWALIYGDQNANPVLLVLAEGVTESKLFAERNVEQTISWTVLQSLSALTSIPLINIRFNIDRDTINTVSWINNGVEEISLSRLSQIFQKFGLPINSGVSQKAINDASSSAYHNWQRSSLGKNIIVSDIDLIKYDTSNARIQSVDELKRSYIPVAEWQPYFDDYPNFKLSWNLFQLANIPFSIVYNHRQKVPYIDNPNELAIFNVDFSRKPPINRIQQCRFDDYFHR